MSVTLRELYESIKEKEEIHIAAGASGLDHIVRWVHMVEGVGISSFLEGDEIAFTTGIALSDAAELLELAEYNHRQQAAGMVINVGPYIKEIPQEVLDFGDNNDFPIFRVPWRVHLANIMREFTNQIHLDEQKKMEVEVAVKNAFYFPDNQEMYLPTLLRHGYKKEWSYCVAEIEILSGDCLAVGVEEKKKLLRFARDTMHRWQKAALIMENGGDIQILCVNVTEQQMQEKLNAFWQEVEKYRICEGSFYGGVGSVAERIGDIGKSFAAAEQIKRLQKKRHRKNQIMTYGEMGLYKLLFSLEGQEVLTEYYEETLGALAKYDYANESDYGCFLKKYFELGCSVQELAAELHMHRNSVTYKIHKIEEILGLSLNSQENRTKIIIAFMIEEICG